jgi:ABC-type uncharacterized transport system permease subunit
MTPEQDQPADAAQGEVAHDAPTSREGMYVIEEDYPSARPVSFVPEASEGQSVDKDATEPFFVAMDPNFEMNTLRVDAAGQPQTAVREHRASRDTWAWVKPTLRPLGLAAALALLIWGANPKAYTPVVSGTLQLFDGQLSISYVSILTVACCVVIMVALTLFTGKTRMGKAMRACSEDKGAAQLMGINVNRTISLTFAIGSALAAVAGALLCSFSPTLMPTTGSMPGIKAFTAAVFGGIGSIPGAFIGGILLGVIEALGRAYISTQLSNSIVFAVLIIILLVRPAGLLGKRTQEKV